MSKRKSKTLLKVDIDIHPLDLLWLFRTTDRIETVINILQLQVIRREVKRTSHGQHIRLWIEGKLKPLEVVLIQSLLGSDFRRECFNYKRIKKGYTKNWNVLFNKKYRMDTTRLLSFER